MIEIDLSRMAYCSLCTNTASYGTNTASYSTDMVRYGTDTISYGTDMISYSSSGKKGLPGLCSVLPPASNIGVLCNQDCSQYFVSYTVQPQRPPFEELPQALC